MDLSSQMPKQVLKNLWLVYCGNCGKPIDWKLATWIIPEVVEGSSACPYWSCLEHW